MEALGRSRRVGAVLAAMGLAALAAASSCDRGAYGVTAWFEDGALRDRARAIEVALVRSCGDLGRTGADPGEVLLSLRFRLGETSGELGAVPPGAYGLLARARDEACVVVAAGCTAVDLEAGGRADLVVRLSAVDGPGCDADEVCAAGLCEPSGADADADADDDEDDDDDDDDADADADVDLDADADGETDADAEVEPDRLGRDGRWLTFGGSPVFVVGADMQSLVGQLPGWEGQPGWDGDYVRVLDALRDAGIGKVRLWANNWFVDDPFALLQPFLRLEDGRYDLDQWDERYWERLRDFVAEARERGILVEYCLFSQLPNTTWWQSPTNYWYEGSNVNGAFRDRDGYQGAYRELFDEGGETTSSGQGFRHYQLALIDKAVSELDRFGNVFYEVLNGPRDIPTEHGPAIWPWTRAMAEAIHEAGGLVAVEARSSSPPETWSEYAGLPSVDLLTYHSHELDPNQLGAELHPWQGVDQVLACNESFGFRAEGLGVPTREAWGWALSGGYYAFYQEDSSFVLVGDDAWEELARVTRTMREVMESMPFWRLSAVGGGGVEVDRLVSQGPASDWQVSADPGEAWLAYFWGTPSSREARIELPAGEHDYEWRDVRGPVLATGRVTTSGGAVAIPAPPTTWSGELGLLLIVRRA